MFQYYLNSRFSFCKLCLPFFSSLFHICRNMKGPSRKDRGHICFEVWSWSHGIKCEISAPHPKSPQFCNWLLNLDLVFCIEINNHTFNCTSFQLEIDIFALFLDVNFLPRIGFGVWTNISSPFFQISKGHQWFHLDPIKKKKIPCSLGSSYWSGYLTQLKGLG